MKPVIATRKLKLTVESVRLLNETDLKLAAGGMPMKTDLCTAGPCGTRG